MTVVPMLTGVMQLTVQAVTVVTMVIVTMAMTVPTVENEICPHRMFVTGPDHTVMTVVTVLVTVLVTVATSGRGSSDSVHADRADRAVRARHADRGGERDSYSALAFARAWGRFPLILVWK
jgi:hypothetical protein